MSGAKHTPGPWRWRVVNNSQVANHVLLESEDGIYVMSFKRKGMNEATPCFYVDGLQRSIFDLEPIIKKSTHDIGVRHPDAMLIAAAPDLLAACERLVALRIGASTAEISAAIDDGVTAIMKAKSLRS